MLPNPGAMHTPIPIRNRPMRYARTILVQHTAIGMLAGWLVLHPVTMAIYWFEFNGHTGFSTHILLEILERVFLSFSPLMLSMAGLFVLFGGAMGLASGWYYRALRRKDQQLAVQEQSLQQSLRSLLEAGENTRVEFKSSVRWDHKQGKLNKALEHVVIKTLAGFMNGGGGILLLGVYADGRVVGVRKDYPTLKKPNSDGYEQHLMHLVSTQLRADLCDLVHVGFHELDGEEICMVTVAPSARPVYVHQGNLAKYYLRTGNATRELNTQEAVHHVMRRFAPTGGQTGHP